ncbi:MAG: hypothetical protein JNL49_05035 [Bacteroidia bacterium]|nr:hypothetical protein [Bacteroidia bacterium]
MTQTKKELPLTLLLAIKQGIPMESLLYSIVDSPHILHAVDKDPNSDFFFSIKGYETTNGKFHALLKFKPRNKDSISVYEPRIEIKSLSNVFSNWANLLREYEKIKIFDDPILKCYEDEFLSNFEILDDDADFNSFDLKTQIIIDQYLEYCETKLLDAKTEANNNVIEDVLAEVKFLKENQTILTKRKVIQKLARIWAKTRKIGMKLLMDIYEEAKKEIIRQLIRGNIDLGN